MFDSNFQIIDKHNASSVFICIKQVIFSVDLVK